jgi:hypothetical protein
MESFRESHWTNGTLGDMDGADRPDVVTNGGNFQMFLLLNRGGGVLAPTASVKTIGRTFALTTADLNGDGLGDVVGADIEKNTLEVFLSQCW